MRILVWRPVCGKSVSRRSSVRGGTAAIHRATGHRATASSVTGTPVKRSASKVVGSGVASKKHKHLSFREKMSRTRKANSAAATDGAGCQSSVS